MHKDAVYNAKVELISLDDLSFIKEIDIGYSLLLPSFSNLKVLRLSRRRLGV
jgi:hypothetical protein